MIEVGKNAGEYFEKHRGGSGRYQYTMKTRQQYAAEHDCKEPVSKRYFAVASLEDTIKGYPLSKRNASEQDIDRGIFFFFFPFEKRPDIKKKED